MHMNLDENRMAPTGHQTEFGMMPIGLLLLPHYYNFLSIMPQYPHYCFNFIIKISSYQEVVWFSEYIWPIWLVQYKVLEWVELVLSKLAMEVFDLYL